MNPISSTKHKFLAYGIATVFLGAASLASASDDGDVQTAGNFQVVATVAGKAENRQIAIGAAKLRTVDYRWAD